MNLKRRQFLTCASTLLAAPVFAVSDRNSQVPLFLSAASDADDHHWVIGFEHRNGVIHEAFKHRLPARAHHIAVHDELGIYIVLARRPDRYLWIGDLATGDALTEIHVPHERHLYGHGVFNSKGTQFYTTENAWQFINGDSGRVVVWDIARHGNTVSMSRQREFPSYGIGPHELLLKQDNILVVANGGIRTHPDRDREKLNIESMQPSLVYIDAASGNLVEQQSLDTDWHKASIRHLDINSAGQVAMGLQFEGEPFERAPLVATHSQGEPVRIMWAPEPQQGQMSQYVGSVRYDNSGQVLAATCPRGNLITFWDSDSSEMINSLRSRDGCGICAVDNGFLYTAGSGNINHYDPHSDMITELDESTVDPVFWDNHLSIRAG